MPDPVTSTALAFGAIEATASLITMGHLGPKVARGGAKRSFIRTDSSVIVDMEDRIDHIRKLFSEYRLPLNYGARQHPAGNTQANQQLSQVENQFQTLYEEYLGCKSRLEDISGRQIPEPQAARRPKPFRSFTALFGRIKQEVKDLNKDIERLEQNVTRLSEESENRRKDLKLKTELMVSKALSADLEQAQPRLERLSASEQWLQVRAIATKYIGEEEAELFASDRCEMLKNADTHPPPVRPSSSSVSSQSPGWHTPDTHSSPPESVVEDFQLTALTERLRNARLGNRRNPDPFADPSIMWGLPGQL
ncbi:hypothetical protein PQX77_004512 [Marasmius sp. AFHP31]|nr:hypothetical protein PQX77_004512 [Marasmius sp. AFHP31]